MKLGNNSQLKYLFKNLIDGADDSVDVIGKALKTPKQLPDTGTTASYDWIDDILDGWITPSRTRTSYVPLASVADPVRQEALKQALRSKWAPRPLGPYGHYGPYMKLYRPSQTRRAPAMATGAEDEPMYERIFQHFNGFPKETSRLGNVYWNPGARHLYQPFGEDDETVQSVPWLPTSGLVVQPALTSGWYNIGIRPHKNTRLGKWFAERFPNWNWYSKDGDLPF